MDAYLEPHKIGRGRFFFCYITISFTSFQNWSSLSISRNTCLTSGLGPLRRYWDWKLTKQRSDHSSVFQYFVINIGFLAALVDEGSFTFGNVLTIAILELEHLLAWIENWYTYCPSVWVQHAGSVECSRLYILYNSELLDEALF